jgi:GAF domain-containing protein
MPAPLPSPCRLTPQGHPHNGLFRRTEGRATGVSLPESSMPALARLAGVVLGQEDLDTTLTKVTKIAVEVLPPAEGASITSFEHTRPSTVAASDEWSRSLDELQYVEHEGPCLDCGRLGNVFRVVDLAQDARWPTYGPRAAANGARSSLSLPLTADGRLVGALNLYSRSPAAFDGESVSMAEVIAAHAGMAHQVATAFFGHKTLAEQLRVAIESRATIEQAKGIVMAQAKVTADAAFDLLVALSQRRNVKLHHIAGDIVRTGSVEDIAGG